jgi:2,3-bisphosphoglycerate-dependent phosphoglycerate mutase
MPRPRPVQLLVVRHGETTWNGAGRIQGSRDSPLTARGLAQARATGARLASERVGALYSSDLGRAQQTAREVAAATALPIRTDARLRERAFGVLEGKTWEEIARDHPIDAQLLREDPFRPAPGGESLAQFRDRVTGALARIAAEAGTDRIAIVTHGGVLGVLYREAAGIPLHAPRTYTTPNAAVNHLEYAGGRWSIVRWADVDHLPADESLDDVG